MVEVGKIGAETLVLDSRYISIFRAGKLVWKRAYRGYILPDGNLYSYRRRVRITELSGKTLTDYQIKIEIGAGDPIWKHARSAGEDIRFCYYPEENMLSYWIEKFDPDAEEAIIWVKVPSIPANSEIEIYMYYGNPEVASASDAVAVFEFFDDFEDGIYTDKWSPIHDITWQELNGYIEQTNDPGGGSSSNYHGLQSLKTFNSNGGWFYLTARLFPNSNSAYDTAISLGLHPTDPGGTEAQRDYGVMINTYSEARDLRIYYPGGYKALTQVHPYNIWYRVKIWYKGSSGFEWEIIREDTGEVYWQGSATDSAASTEDLYVFLGGDNEGMRWDDILIRKYTEPEPSVSVGAEE